MGRLSQLFWILQAEEMPTPVETRHHYTHLNMATPTRRKEMAKLRREYRKSSALEDAAVPRDRLDTPCLECGLVGKHLRGCIIGSMLD